ncbi:LORF2 protein, partial [Crocuta crocuta]
ENLHDLGYDGDFVDTIPKAQSMKEISDKLDFIKIKNFCSAKDRVRRVRTQDTQWKKIFAKDPTAKGLLPKIQEELLKLNNKKMNNPIKKWVQDLHGYVTKKDIWMVNKHMKNFSTSYVIREIQIKSVL